MTMNLPLNLEPDRVAEHAHVTCASQMQILEHFLGFRELVVSIYSIERIRPETAPPHWDVHSQEGLRRHI
jgi:hypothetical protein